MKRNNFYFFASILNINKIYIHCESHHASTAAIHTQMEELKIKMNKKKATRTHTHTIENETQQVIMFNSRKQSKRMEAKKKKNKFTKKRRTWNNRGKTKVREKSVKRKIK